MENNEELLQDIRDRTIRLEAKLDDVHELKTELKEIKKDSITALNMATHNEEDIAEIKSTLTWLWRSVGGIIAGLLLWFLQHELHL